MTSPAEFLPVLTHLAQGSGEILMRYFRKLSGYEKKGAVDLQTIADRESERFLASEIHRLFPDHSILAEEDGTVLHPGSDYLWIVDPLDGTTNYAHKLRIFAVSIGLTYKGERIAGAIFAPALDELYLAARGHGATLNGEPLQVSNTDTLDDSLLVTGFPYDRRPHIDELTRMHREALLATRGVLRLGAAALDLAAVAAGSLDCFYEWGVRPWDMAAGALLVEEAGGKVTGLLPGEPFDLFRPRIVASNGRIHSEVQELIARAGFGKLPG